MNLVNDFILLKAAEQTLSKEEIAQLIQHPETPIKDLMRILQADMLNQLVDKHGNVWHLNNTTKQQILLRKINELEKQNQSL